MRIGNEQPGLHNRLALFRVERGLSRAALAELVAVNPQTIGFLERGEYGPSLELGLKLAMVFGVPVEILFSLSPFQPLAAALAGGEPVSNGEGVDHG
jgi:DNA-binding XRE family transcriptional regulator